MVLSWDATAEGKTVLRRVANDTPAPPAVQPSSPTPPDKPANKPYTSRIVKEDSAIVLKGQVPSEADVKILQGVIAATSPGATFVDKSHVNAGITERDIWLAGMTFALRQLAKLDRGAANLRDNQISFDGTAKTAESFHALQQKFSEELPKGLVLAQLDLKPPAERGNVWSAQIKPGSLNLMGYVPKDFDQTLMSYAKSSFQNVQINSSMAQGNGASNEWMEAAKVALDMLKLLQQGNATLRDKIITIDGVYSGPGMAALLKEFDQKLPKGFHLEINVLEPAAVRMPVRHRNLDVVTREEQVQLTPDMR